jgi:DNA-directed RNA polymerase specialized sigma subunit
MLKKYGSIKKEKERIKARIEEIESMLYSPRNQNLSGMPTAHDAPNDTQEKLIEKKEQLLKVYRRFLLQLDETELSIENAIESLADPNARTILRCRYIDGMRWEAICVKIGYEWAQVHRIHKNALETLKDDTQ